MFVPYHSSEHAHAHCFSSIPYRKEDVLLVLIHGAWIQNWICMLDHRYTLTSQQRLIDANGGRVDGGDSDVSRHFVTDRHFDDVSRNQLSGLDALDLSGSILSHDFRDFGLVLFECFDGALGIPFLDVTGG